MKIKIQKLTFLLAFISIVLTANSLDSDKGLENNSTKTNTEVENKFAINLTIQRDNTIALTHPEQLYKLKIENLTNENIAIDILIENIIKQDIIQKQIELSPFIYATEIEFSELTNNKLKNIIPANSNKELLVKLIIPENSEKNTFNFSKIVALNESGQIISNTIEIKTFIPDPKDFQ
jgi:hypothetical protein